MGNDLIDNGGFYWFGTFDSVSINYIFGWILSTHLVGGDQSNAFGVRPVLVLDLVVITTDGDGTSENPYKIALK